MAKNKMTTCAHCGAEIASGAKACPNCGGNNKKPIFKRVWFWILIVIAVIAIAGVAGSGDDEGSSSGAAGDKQSEAQAQEKEEPAITYTSVTVDELTDALDNNAAAASDEYKGNYYEVKGRLGTIDSDGNYIELNDIDDEWNIIGVTCYIKSDEQLEAVKKMSTDQEVVVKGKITDVGEVLGYYLNIDSIE